MRIPQRPIAATIGFGLICGLSFIPADLALSAVVSRPSAICLTLWLFAAGHALLLSRWSGQKFSAVMFPILVLLVAVFLVDSIAAFFLLMLAVTSWIRSGICFTEMRAIKLAVEILLCGVGGTLVSVFTPGAVYGWALGTWMFFLLQSLYFVIFENRIFAQENEHEFGIDNFERASRQAEIILENCIPR
jgi:Na+/H+-translocating membrane pyrophosphatase